MAQWRVRSSGDAFLSYLVLDFIIAGDINVDSGFLSRTSFWMLLLRIVACAYNGLSLGGLIVPFNFVSLP